MDASPFHPDLRRAARFLPRGGVGPALLPAVRALGTVQARRAARHAEVVRVGAASAWVQRPTGVPASGGRPRPALLWIHGGGYVIGTAAQDLGVCRHFADELGAVVAAVDYRLAPGHRFPAALEDCHDTLVWLANRPEVDPSRIAVGGMSAGGGLAVALALLAHRRGEVRPAFQLLAYPMLDDRTATRGDLDQGHYRLWNNRSNRDGWEAYTGLPPGSPDVEDLAAPARAGDLSVLPPAWLGVGTCDLFYEEDVAYAERLRAAGVPCELEVVEGAFHGFDAVLPRAGVSQRFRAAQVGALAAALTR